MRATVMYGPYDVRLDEVPDPVLAVNGPAAGFDAVVRVVACCVCRSDLRAFRGTERIRRPRRQGHEWVGVVERVGTRVSSVNIGDFVLAPMYVCDGSCFHCRNGVSVSCIGGGYWGTDVHDKGFADGGQGERVRVPLADGTLARVPGGMPATGLIPSLLALSDVMSTGHHAARGGRVTKDSTVAVVGDDDVALCAIIAARRLGAARVVALSRHGDTQGLAREFGAADVLTERGLSAVDQLKEMFDGIGPDVVLECEGTKGSMDTAMQAVRAGGRIGYVGAPTGGAALDTRLMFARNISASGGLPFVREYIDELLPDVVSGAIVPGKLFDLELPLAEVRDAYMAMDERRAIKVLLRP